MPLTNYHQHFKYCDGVGEIDDHVQVAIDYGVISMGFTSHSPVPFESAWSMKEGDMPAYLADLDAAKRRFADRIAIYKGLEIDFLEKWPGQIRDWTSRAGLDFSIGSVHFVKAFEDGSPWEIDGTLELFSRGLRQIFSGDIEAAVSHYFDLTCQMLESDPPTILGHVDKIKMHNSRYPFFEENADWYQKKLVDTLEIAKKAGVFVEVNTRGIYKKRTIDTYPGAFGLKVIRDLNIPICLNSDAHTPDEVTKEFEQTRKVLLDVGFRELMVLSEGQWESVAVEH